MRICFFVSNPEGGVISSRAEGFKSFLSGKYEVRIFYKKGHLPCDFMRWLFYFLQNKPDIVYIIDTGVIGVSIAVLAKIFFRKKIICDTGDLTDELLRQEGRYLKAHIMRIVEDVAFYISDAIVVRGSFHKEWLEQKGFKRIHHIPDGVDTEKFKPMEVEDLREKLGLKDVFTIGFLGSIVWNDKYKWCYGWDSVELLKILKDYPVKGVIVGDGSGMPHLKKKIEEYNIADKIVFMGYVKYEELPKYLNLMDVCLLTQSNTLPIKMRTTGKLPLYLSTGRFIIASDVGDAGRILKNKKLGILLPHRGMKDETYPSKEAEEIKKLLQNRERIREGMNGIEVAREFFDYRLLSKKLSDIIEHLF